MKIPRTNITFGFLLYALDKLIEQANEYYDPIKEELAEIYFIAKQTILDDYPIFMAIAEDIGYDATGRETQNNELIEI